MPRSRRILFVSGGVIAVLLFILIGFVLWLYPSHEKADYRFAYATDASLELIYLEVAGTRFAVPKAYIWDPSAWKGGARDGINMHALLPDLEPYSEKNKAEFDSPGLGKVVTFLVHHNDNGRTAKKKVFERLMAMMIDPASAKPYEFGLIHYSYSEQHKREKDFLVHKEPSGVVHFFDCRQEGTAPYPSCRTYLDYNDHVYVEINFSRHYLKDWKDIEAKVLSLIATFETKD